MPNAVWMNPKNDTLEVQNDRTEAPPMQMTAIYVFVLMLPSYAKYKFT